MRRRVRTVHSPEHVAITLVPAGLGSRFAAALLDLLIISAVCGAVSRVGGLLPAAVSGALVITLCFVVSWGYWIFFEVARQGQTPGKSVLKLRVVDGRGLPIGLAQSLVRNIVRIIDAVPLGGVGMIAAILDPHHRRLGDLAADTMVVAEKQPRVPDLETAGARRHNSLRTARVRKLLDLRVGLEERELLLALCVRAPVLDERARYDLFEAAGEYYRKRLSIEDPLLSGEAVVRGLVSLCYGDREG
jgi:uncharacterized RDD family membrane protein YckC